jgi:hypothetical protein
MGEVNGTTTWRPQTKVVGAAIATVVVAGIQAATGWDAPTGFEAALATVVAYLIPNR